jgi:YVTN family beta-propeller protein
MQMTSSRLARVATSLALLLLAGCTGMSGNTASSVPESAVLATLPAGNPPVLLAVQPNGQHVYAAGDGILTIIDTASNTVAANVTVNPQSTGIAAAPDGSRVYVASLFSIDLNILDTSSNALLPSITMFLQRLRGGFGFMAVAPNGQTIYIANRANQRFGILDLTGQRSSILTPTVWPVDMAVTPDGKTVVSVGCKQICTPGFIQLFDTASQLFTQEIQVDGNPYRVVLSPDGGTAYVANLTGPSLSFVDLATRTVTNTVRVPVQPTGLAISPDGATLYVASQTQGALSVVDVASASLRGQLSVPQARDVVATPDGRRVYVSSGNRVLAVDAQALAAAP